MALPTVEQAADAPTNAVNSQVAGGGSTLCRLKRCVHLTTVDDERGSGSSVGEAADGDAHSG
jgi:hypothetical protein